MFTSIMFISKVYLDMILTYNDVMTCNLNLLPTYEMVMTFESDSINFNQAQKLV